ncbi:Zinc finger SWIM domain-containing protein 8 [Holothuria leucospilota]|uniref:Zinc finger SWIM domain-containing protein 8 n=1 Tax=Holothuria leucospilota TaxID=206669 RepID=A0A9Q0YGE8_HOLLE|nr:Zinc finger SWIM domain-containing protein 8 [Holothuria leucospilota]
MDRVMDLESFLEYSTEWDDQGDQQSFEDSDRFEDESYDSMGSDTESLCPNNWRGWKKPGGSERSSDRPVHLNVGSVASVGAVPDKDPEVLPLCELAAKTVAHHIPFEVVEKMYPEIPENLQLRIAFWSFPENEEDIRLYSCLANGSPDEFQKGELLVRSKLLENVLQIGFHLGCTIESFNVAITFDRCRISSCSCTCNTISKWCSHVVALCLYRMQHPEALCLRAPVSESLSRLQRDQLQKFAQYLISELPQQILPTAQKLLDELLLSESSLINTVAGAPDPTAGPSATELTRWFLDETTLHENIRKTLIKFSGPQPVVLSDVNSLHLPSTAPVASLEYTNLLKPLRGREPEGIWNLLSIVKEMLRRKDSNAILLLKVITEECLVCEQIVVWWFYTRTSALHSQHGNHGHRANSNSQLATAQHAGASMCDEIVNLWRLACLNPSLTPEERQVHEQDLRQWHLQVLKARGLNFTISGGSGGASGKVRKVDVEIFPGFKPAIEACMMDWADFPIPGVTFFDRDVGTETEMGEGKLENGEDAESLQSQKTEVSPKQEETQFTSSCAERHQGIISDFRTSTVPTVNVLNDSFSIRTSESNSQTGIEKRTESSPKVGHTDENNTLHRVNSSDSGESSSSDKIEGYHTGATMSHTDDSDSDSRAATSGQPTVARAEVGVTESPEQVAAEKLGAKRKVKSKHFDLLDSDLTDSDVAPSNRAKSETKENAKSPVHLEPEVIDHSAARQSSDEYQVYFYDTKAKPAEAPAPKRKDNTPNPFAGIKKTEDAVEVMFARAEALYAHGYSEVARELAVQLAEQLLASPPVLDTPPPLGASNKVRKKHSYYISALASMTLHKIHFLGCVLSEIAEYRHLAFRVGMYGLELARQPASTKAMEVKLNYQEQEIVNLLKKIPLNLTEILIIRNKAQHLCNGTLPSRGEALLPTMLATFIFDALCLPSEVPAATLTGSMASYISADITASDMKLGFDAAVAALAMKTNISEADNPLLCEGIRRQRGELALAMLVHYKDHPLKHRKILDALLDKQGAKVKGSNHNQSASHHIFPKPTNYPPQSHPVIGHPSKPSEVDAQNLSAEEKLRQLSLQDDKQRAVTSDQRGEESDKAKSLPGTSGYLNNNSAYWEKMLARQQKRSKGMASIDSSAPETTSSDNSPTMGRRFPGGWVKHQGPGSDSGSSGNSSDSLSSSSSGEGISISRTRCRESKSPGQGIPTVLHKLGTGSPCDNNGGESRSSTPSSKGNRKGRRGRHDNIPTVPNQPSEASAFYFFELAKTVLQKAGGPSSISVYCSSTSRKQSPPHRGLLLCAFEIGLYALRLNNTVSPNWLSRTYSTHVSWIINQASEIGTPAITMLVEGWEGHLTPAEAASVADRASRGMDPNLVRAAAELALSCLHHAHALSPNEVNRAIMQCKEQDAEMLEKACLAVEHAAKGGDVHPEVLFNVARQWKWLYDEYHHRQERRNQNEGEGNQQPQENQQQPQQQQQQPQQQMLQFHPPNVPICAAYGLPPQLPQGMRHNYHIGYPDYVPIDPYLQHVNVGIRGFRPRQHVVGDRRLPVHRAAMSQDARLHWNVPQLCLPHQSACFYHPQSGGTLPPHQAMQPLPQASNNMGQPQLGHFNIHGGVRRNGHPLPPNQAPPILHVGQAVPPHQQPDPGIVYLHAAYRSGMLAIDILKPRLHDERTQARFSTHPPYGEDIKWLMKIAMKLGTSFLQQFCACVLNAVVSPSVLHCIAWDAAQYLYNTNQTPVQANLRSPFLSPIVQKCVQMYIQSIHQRLYHIGPNDHDDFISTVQRAQQAFMMAPGGLQQFSDFIQSLGRLQPSQGELWTRLSASLSGNVVDHNMKQMKS